MADLTINARLSPLQGTQGPSDSQAITRPVAVEGKDFKSFLLESLAKVNQLQTEADAGVQKLLTGQTDNIAEVLGATRKAEIAFDLLMEIRNKLLDAYSEIRQIRV